MIGEWPVDIRTLLWEFFGDYRKAARYCRRIAAARGEMADDYAYAAELLEKKADDLDRQKQG